MPSPPPTPRNSEHASGTVELHVAQWDDRLAGTVHVTGSQGFFGQLPRPFSGVVSGDSVTFTAHGVRCAVEARLTFTRGRRSDQLAGSFSCEGRSSVTLNRVRKAPRPAASSLAAPAAPQGLTLTLTAPDDGTRIDENPVYVVGQARGTAPVARVVITRNDTEVYQYRPEPATEKGMTLAVAIELLPGANVIRVTVADTAGVDRTEERRVELKKR